MNKAKGSAVVMDPVSNGAKSDIEETAPYTLRVTIEGTAPLLFHKWDGEAVESKQKAAKGSKTKKSDNVESYVPRDLDGKVAIPGEYFRQSSSTQLNTNRTHAARGNPQWTSSRPGCWS